MESRQRQKWTPFLVLKVCLLALSTFLAICFSAYGGYHQMLYVIPPISVLAFACSLSMNQMSRYIKGTMFQETNPNSIKCEFFLGGLLLCLTISGAFYFAITGALHFTAISKAKKGFKSVIQFHNNIIQCLLFPVIVQYLSEIFEKFTLFEVSNSKGFEYKNNGLYAALGSCLLAIFWFCVVIYDARYYWKIWPQMVGDKTAKAHP